MTLAVSAPLVTLITLMQLDHTDASVLLGSHASAQTKPVLCCSVQPGPSSGWIPITRGGQGCPFLRALVCSGCHNGTPQTGGSNNTFVSHSSGCCSASSRRWRGRAPSETLSHGWGRPPALCSHGLFFVQRETVNERWSLPFLTRTLTPP